MFEGVLQWLIDTISNGINWVFQFLNGLNPFPALINGIETSGIAEWLSWANYFFDFSYLVHLIELLLAAIAVWYGIQILLRWLKVIE